MGFDLLVACLGERNVCLSSLLRCLLEGMQYVDRVLEFGSVDDPPLTFPVIPDTLSSEYPTRRGELWKASNAEEAPRKRYAPEFWTEALTLPTPVGIPGAARQLGIIWWGRPSL